MVDAMTLRLSAAYLAVFLALGATLPYVPAFLNERGLSGEQVGLAVATGMVCRTIFSPLGGWLADATGRPRFVFAACGLATAIVYAAQYVTYSVWWLIALSGLAGAASSAIVPITESLAITASGKGLHYGRVRSVGSAAFMAASVGMGALANALGFNTLPIWLFVCGLLIFGAAFGLPAPEAPAPTHRKRTDLSVLVTLPAILALTASAAIQGAHAFYYGFSVIAWRGAGLSETVIGVLWAVGVLAEIVALAAFGRRLERFGSANLFLLGGVSAVVRWTVLAFEPGLPVIFLVQTLHAGSFALAHLGFITFIRANVPEGARATVQSLNSSLALGGVLALGTWASGVLYDGHGSKGYLAMTALACFGCLAACALIWLERRAPHSAGGSAAA